MSTDRPDQLLRGPKWRTRTTAGRRHRAAAATFAVVLVVGSAVMWGTMRLLTALGAGSVVTFLLWAAPTAAAVVWTIVHPTTARLSDDDDDTWVGYSIRWALVGELEARPAPVRIVTALLFGAPVAWSLAVLAVLTLLGIA